MDLEMENVRVIESIGHLVAEHIWSFWFKISRYTEEIIY